MSEIIFPHIYKIQASAGAGKTRKISEQILTFLLSDSIPFSDINNILAITFTNKAASEMKERIMEWLKHIALDDNRDAKFDAANLKQVLMVDDKKIQQKAATYIERILRNYGEFQIRTIDSFCKNIVDACSLQLNVPLDYEVEKDIEFYQEFALDSILKTITKSEKNKKIFLDFLQNYIEIEERYSWLPKKDILEAVKFMQQAEDSSGLYFARYGKNNDFTTTQKNIKDLIRKLLDVIGSESIAVKAQYASALSKALELSGVKMVSTLKSWLQKEDASEILKKNSANVSSVFFNTWEKIQKQNKFFIETYSYSKFNYYLDIFNEIKNILQEVKEKNRMLFLGELNRKVVDLFKTNPDIIPEIYYRLSERFYHYFIDEFQDTSIIQWENIKPLVDEAISCGGSLCYVGDKKQAIYGFRGGSAKIFDEVEKSFSHRAFSFFHDNLDLNYRSRKKIVEFNNKIFDSNHLLQWAGAGKDIINKHKNVLSDVFNQSGQVAAISEQKDGGYVECRVIKAEKKDESANCANDYTLKIIEDLSNRGFSYSDIAILTRDNKTASDITSFLIENGKIVESYRTVNIKQNPVVKDLVSFLYFLHSPINNLAFAAFITGDIFSKATKINSQDIHKWLRKVRHKKETFLYTEFKKWKPSIWNKYFGELLKEVGFLPPYDLTCSIIEKFDIWKNFDNLTGFFMHFLEILNNLEQGGDSNLVNFMDFWDKAKEDDENFMVKLPSLSNAIKVMTMHKAKGLQFPVVILPFLHVDIKVGIKGAGFNALIAKEKDNLNLLHINKAICGVSSKLDEIYEKEYLNTFLNEFNLIYVAATRAEDELYVLIPEKINKEKNILRSLFFETENEEFSYGEKTRKQKEAEKEQKFISPIINKKHLHWQDAVRAQLTSPEAVTTYKSEGATTKGDIVHYVLASFKNLSDSKNYKKDVMQQAKTACHLFGCCGIEDEISETISKIMENKKLRKFFYLAENEKVYNEKEIADKNGNIKRADRIIVSEDACTVIEYKTGKEHLNKHEIQIKEYLSLAKQAFSKKVTNGILLYVDENIFYEINL